MSIQELSKTKKEYHSTPFFTPFQEEAQNIIKELWRDQQSYLDRVGGHWLYSKKTEDDTQIPTAIIYSKKWINDSDAIIYDCNEKEYFEKGFMVELINFEKYSPYETSKINILGTQDTNIKGISILAIMNMLHYDFIVISNFHKDIINIHESDLGMRIKKSCINRIIKDIDMRIEENSYKFNFRYHTEVVKNLNYIFENDNYRWINDSFSIYLALEAHQEIIYYQEWLKKYKIEDKRFKEKISIIKRNVEEYEVLGKSKYSYRKVLPRHPQDIIHELISNYLDYNKIEKGIKDEGMQAIVQTISNYQRMPKKTKTRKEQEEITKQLDMEMEELRLKDATKIEITEHIIDRIFGKKIIYKGDE